MVFQLQKIGCCRGMCRVVINPFVLSDAWLKFLCCSSLCEEIIRSPALIRFCVLSLKQAGFCEE